MRKFDGYIPMMEKLKLSLSTRVLQDHQGLQDHLVHLELICRKLTQLKVCCHSFLDHLVPPAEMEYQGDLEYQ